MKKASCPNGCESPTFIVDIPGTCVTLCEVTPIGNIVEEFDSNTDLVSPFDVDRWECQECGDFAVFDDVDETPKKSKKGKKA